MRDKSAAAKALEPSVVRAIIEAFESAAEALRAQGRLTDQAREALARTIIDLAESGECSLTELAKAALDRLGQQQR